MPKPKRGQKRPLPDRGAEPARLTLKQRVGITECMSLIALLSEAATPHAKALAMLVFMRIKAIGDGAAALPAAEEECRRMVDFANSLELETEPVR